MKKENDNIIKFQKGFQINIGFVLIVIIFLYIAFHIFSSLTKQNITVYEVEEGTIVTNNNYQALAIREEEVVNASQSGSIYYYGRNKSRVGVRSPIYAVDTTGSLSELLSVDEEMTIPLDAKDVSLVAGDVDAFIHDFNLTEFHHVYSFKSNLEDTLQDIYTSNVQDTYADKIEAAQKAETFIRENAASPGLLCYTIDGMEGVTVETFDSGNFDIGSLEISNLRSKDEIIAGEPVYKLIKSDDWKLVVPIEEDVADQVREISSIQIKFLADNAKTWASLELTQRGTQDYLILSMDDSMERYADSRFINIELLLDSKSGLKIPNSAITEKEFFVVSKSLFLQGADKSEPGLMIKRQEGDIFVMPTIYYETEDAYYIDNEDVNSDDRIISGNSKDTVAANAHTAKLKGVYSVNKGYTVFKQIETLYQNEDYAVIKTGTDYGISLYDHIALQAKEIRENVILN